MSLVLALFAFWGAKKTSIALNEAARTTEKISQQLSTKYAGRFPEFVPDIVGALQRADKDIFILSDVPAYGIYSNHDAYLDYEDVLKKKVRSANLRMIVLGTAARRKMLETQFKNRRFDDLTKETNFTFFLKWDEPNAAKVKSLDDFIAEISRIQDVEERDFRAITQVHHYQRDLPVFLWLVDDKIGGFRFLISLRIIHRRRHLKLTIPS